MSYYFYLWEITSEDFGLQKAHLAQNHSTKPPTTLCQPSSRPDTRPFTALTSVG